MISWSLKHTTHTYINQTTSFTNLFQQSVCYWKYWHCVKSAKYWGFSGPYFPVFRMNTRKYVPGKPPYLDTFYIVKLEKGKAKSSLLYHIISIYQIYSQPVFFHLRLPLGEKCPIRSFFWSVFSCTQIECGDLRSKSP